MPYVRTHAVVLRCTDYSENSQVAALVTPDRGQIHILAKGSRRPRKDGRVPLDVLTHCDVVIAARKPGQLHLLTDWSLRSIFPALRTDMARFWTAFHAAEVALSCTSENPDDGPVYHALLRFLTAVDGGEDSALALFVYLAEALKAMGHSPVVDRCVQCGEGLAGPTRFSPKVGGALCGDCPGADPGAIPMSRGGLAVMARVSSSDATPRRLRTTAAQRGEIQRAFAAQIQYHLGRPLRTARFLRLGETGASASGQTDLRTTVREHS